MISYPVDDYNYEIKAICKTVKHCLKEYVHTANEFKNDMTGSCLVCSSVLSHFLNKQGYKTEVVIGEFRDAHDYVLYQHAFAIYTPQQLILDITAEQFGKPGVRVLKKSGKAGKDYKVIYRGKDMGDYIDNHWPITQTLFYHKNNLKQTYRSIEFLLR